MAIDTASQGNDFEIRFQDRTYNVAAGPPATCLKVDGSASGKVTVGSLAGGSAHAGKSDFAEGLTFTGNAGAAVTSGRAVTFDASGNIIHAVVTTGASPPVGVALNSAATGQAVVVCWRGPARGVLSAATSPNRFFLSGTAGQISTTAPAVTGNALVVLGYALNATDLFVQISDRGVSP